MQNLVGDFSRPPHVSSLFTAYNLDQIAFYFFLLKLQKIQHDGLPFLLSFSSTNQTTITSEKTDGKRQEESEEVEKEMHNQEPFEWLG